MPGVCLHLHGITRKSTLLLMHMCIHAHQDEYSLLQYFKSTSYNWMDRCTDTDQQLIYSPLQEEDITSHVWQLWVHGFVFHSCFHWSTSIDLSALSTLLKPFKTERPKMQRIYATDGITQYSWIGLCSVIHWNTKVRNPAPNHFSFLLQLPVIFPSCIVIIIICLFAHIFILISVSSTLPAFKNIAHVYLLPFISTLTHQWQIEEERKT